MKKFTNKIKIALAVIFVAFFVMACIPNAPYTPEEQASSGRQSSGQTVSRATGEYRVAITNDNTHIPNGGVIFVDYSPRAQRPIFSLRTPVAGIAVVGNRVWFDRNRDGSGFTVADGTSFTVVAQLGAAVHERHFTVDAIEPTGFEFSWSKDGGADVRNFDDIFLNITPARHLVEFSLRDPIPGMFVETIDRSFARIVYATHVPAGTPFTIVAEIDRDGIIVRDERTFRAVDGGEFFDDFSSAENFNHNWHITDGAWGSQEENGGVVPENVFLTDDNYLALQANGDYYAGMVQGFRRERGIRTGAAIVSRNIFGPGIFEVRARFAPRVGVCSAIWTFYFENSGFNHEIDFEAPGVHPTGTAGREDLRGQHTFENILYTSWRGDEDARNASGHRMYSTVYDVLPTPANDGNFHTYRFEWRVYPTPSVRFYVNDQFRHVIDTPEHIPCTAARFWVGVWFPNPAFCGDPVFERDYMLVDWVRHTPFTNERTAAELTEQEIADGVHGWSMGRAWSYADIPAAAPGRGGDVRPNPLRDRHGNITPGHNLVSRGLFQSGSGEPIPRTLDGTALRHAAWTLNSPTGSSAEIRPINQWQNHLRIESGAGMPASAVQSIDSVYQHFRLAVNARMRVLSGQAMIMVEFLDYNGSAISSGFTRMVGPTNGFEWIYGTTTAAPARTKRIRVTLTTMPNTTVYFENVDVRMYEALRLPSLEERIANFPARPGQELFRKPGPDRPGAFTW